jgi:drug/metabolite transporter (DMT)-like permease
MSGVAITARETSKLNAEEARPAQQPAQVSPASRVLKAAAWMSVALASFTLIAVAGREAAHGASTLTIMFYRSWMAFAIVLLIVPITGRGFSQFRTPQIRMHGLRSVVHFGAQFSWLYALPLIPLAQLFAIEFTAPLWTALMAPLILRERLTGWRTAAVLLGFTGALIVVRPGSAALNAGTIAALAAAIGFAAHYIITKRLMLRDPAFTVIFYWTLMQTIIASGLILMDFQIPDGKSLAWIFVVAVCGLTAHFGIARAMAHADAIIVTPMDFLRLPLIVMVAAAVYGEPADPLVLVGGALVLIANFLNIWGERQRVVASGSRGISS